MPWTLDHQELHVPCPLCEGRGHVNHRAVGEFIQEFLDSAKLKLVPEPPKHQSSDHSHDDAIGHG